MTTLEFARKCIHFEKAGSPISGPFDDARYNFLRAPLAANDDIRNFRVTVLKAAGCMGTVYLQILIAHHIACELGDLMFVAQTDDDAETWSADRGQEFILSIPDCRRLLKMSVGERERVTKKLWRFRHLSFRISGPSKKNRQSWQLRKILTDESHLEDSYEYGALKEFEDRIQSAGWLGNARHATTAGEEHQEITSFFLDGRQNEWHWRCPNCAKLFMPLWREVTPTQIHAVDAYNTDIFRWTECVDEDATLNSIVAVCPNCNMVFSDTVQDRVALNSVGEYVAMNPNPKSGCDSFRWNVFANSNLAWRTSLQKYLEARKHAELGNLALVQNFAQKQLCAIWRPYVANFGSGKGASDYKFGDVWEVADSIKILTADYQAGKGNEGEHLHTLITQFDRAGGSRRIAYRRVTSFEQLHAMAVEYGVQERHSVTRSIQPKDGTSRYVVDTKPSHVMVDCGYNSRAVFRACHNHGWTAFRGDDKPQFHSVDGKTFSMPYSWPNAESGVVGEKIAKGRKIKSGALPTGWAWVITGCVGELYGYLYALLGGSSARYFGIPSDFDSQFTLGDLREGYSRNMPAFVRVIQKDTFGRDKKPVDQPIRPAHLWDCEIMALVIAMRQGYFPLAKTEPTKKNET